MVLGLGLVLLSNGCASTSTDEELRDMSKLVQDRTGQRIHWDNGDASDERVDRALHRILARELDVDDAVRVALLDNATLQATYEDLTIAKADLVQAGLLKNPSIGGGLEFPIAGNVATGGNLSISEDFLDLFTIAARRKIAGLALERAKLRVSDAVVRTVYDVETAFYSLQAAEQILAMRRAILETSSAGVDIASRQHAAGNISDLDFANQQTANEELLTQVLRSEGEVVAARENLTRLMGVWGADASYKVKVKLPELPAQDPPVDHLESLAMRRRLDLLAAISEEDEIAHALSLAKTSRFLPDATVGATYERAPERYSTLGPNASLELPIFDQKQASVARLEGEHRASIARKNGLAVNIRSEVRAAAGRLTIARAIVERYSKIVLPLREQVVSLSQQQYDAMLIGTYQLLQSKQNEVTAYRELIEALRDYWIARADLERATGGSLTRNIHDSEMRGSR
jgi:cobalt-zinc-cadmium efflux system outer membrane protein